MPKDVSLPSNINKSAILQQSYQPMSSNVNNQKQIYGGNNSQVHQMSKNTLNEVSKQFVNQIKHQDSLESLSSDNDDDSGSLSSLDFKKGK